MLPPFFICDHKQSTDVLDTQCYCVVSCDFTILVFIHTYADIKLQNKSDKDGIMLGSISFSERNPHVLICYLIIR